jgi:hypothetical protein
MKKKIKEDILMNVNDPVLKFTKLLLENIEKYLHIPKKKLTNPKKIK